MKDKIVNCISSISWTKRKASILVIVTACMFVAPSYLSKDTTTFTVSEKERVTKGDDSYYLVYTDQGVFKNEDSWLQLKFNSSDLYGNLKNNTEYTCTKNFWRVRLLSMYENLITCTETK